MVINKRLKISKIKHFSLIKISKNVKIRVYKLVRYIFLFIDTNKDKIIRFLIAGLTVFAMNFLMMGFCHSVIFLEGLMVTVCK